MLLSLELVASHHPSILQLEPGHRNSVLVVEEPHVEAMGALLTLQLLTLIYYRFLMEEREGVACLEQFFNHPTFDYPRSGYIDRQRNYGQLANISPITSLSWNVGL